MRAPLVFAALLAGTLAAGAQDRRLERVGQGPTAAAGSGRWAVVVGVDEYAAAEVPRLAGAVADARAIASALTRFAEFPAAQVFLLTSDAAARPTAQAVLERLAALRAAVKPGDLLLFFFAGHGVEVDGQRYLLTHEARVGSAGALKTSSLPVSLLMQELESIPVLHRLVMIDACRDDPLARGPRRPNLATEAFEQAFTMLPARESGVRATFLSCKRGQSAYEWTGKGRGFFSSFIERGLAGEAAVFGKVTVTSLAGYLNERVPQAVRQQRGKEQTPFMDLKGEALVLVRAERLAAAPATAAAADAGRVVFGVVKDATGRALAGALVTATLDAAGAARGGPAQPAAWSARADEDGFFRIEGAPAAALLQVVAEAPRYRARSLESRPEQAARKLSFFLPRAAVTGSLEGSAVVASGSSASAALVAVFTPTRPAPTPPPATLAPRPTPPPRPASTPEPPPTPPPSLPEPESTPPLVAAAPPTPPPATLPQPAPTPRPTPRPLIAVVIPSGPSPRPTPPPSTFPPRPAPTPQPPAPPGPPPPPPPPAPAEAAQELAEVARQSLLAEEFVAAERAAGEALQLDDNCDLAHAVLASAVAATALAARDMARLAAARSHATRAVARRPDLAEAHNALGLLLVGEARLREAQAEFVRAVALDPRLAPAQANLAYTYDQLGSAKDAERAYREAIRLDPDAALPYNGLAVVLLKLRRAEEAARAVRDAISRYSSGDQCLGSFYLNLALALHEQGQREQAREAAARARSLGITQSPVYDALERGRKG